MAVRTTAVVMVCAVALSAVAAALGMAGILPAPAHDAGPAAPDQVANRPAKADVEIHTNREGKQDRLPLAAQVAPVAPIAPPVRFANLLPPTPRDLLHQSFTAIELPTTRPQRYAMLPPTLPPPAPPKSPLDGIRNPLLNEAQIESIRKRLQLTPAQDRLWPAVRGALYDVVRAHAALQRRARRGQTATLAPTSPEIARLRAAARPLLAQLRPDQHRELRMLAQIVGLESALASL